VASWNPSGLKLKTPKDRLEVAEMKNNNPAQT
jgi:hypothetical protein